MRLKWHTLAVAGSLGAQFVLSGGFRILRYPYDFALLYFVGVPCLILVSLFSAKYDLPAVQEENRGSFIRYAAQSVTTYMQSRILILLWVGYFFWFCVLNSMPNISLYTRIAIGVDPKELSGLILALRFGFKAIAGFALGAIALRWGVRAPVVTSAVLFLASIAWAWAMPGYLYLLAFGLMGAAELGAAYFLNYVIDVSAPATGARNLAVLQLAVPASSLAPVLHGALTQRYGFRASFILAFATALVTLWVVLGLPGKGVSPLHKEAGS